MATKQSNRIGLTLADGDLERFTALAEFEGKKPATLAADIVKEYMKARAADIDSILTARKNYQRELEELRKAAAR